MREVISLHVICKYVEDPGTKRKEPKGLKMLDKIEKTYKSISWRVKSEHIEGLKGKPFCMHEKKTEKSYFGGIITDIKREPIPDNKDEVRAIVFFTATESAKKIAWPPTNNKMEYLNINYVD